MTELLGRVGLAAFVLMVAAAVVTTTGSGGLGGRLGGLFGFTSPTLAAPEQPVTLKPTSRATLVAATDTRRNFRAARPGGERKPRRRDTPSPPRHRSPSSATPAPSPGQPPAPAPVPIPVPKPSPGGGPGPTDQVAQVVRQAVQPVPPAQAPAEQVIQTVQQVCGLVGGCPS